MQKDPFLLFLNQLPEAAIIINDGQQILYANHKCESLLGYSPDELTNINFISLLQNKQKEKQVSHEPFAPGKYILNSINGEIVLVEASSSEVTLEKQSAILVLLHHIENSKTEILDLIKDDVIKTWGIGILEHDHITGKISCSKLVYELYDIPFNQALSLELLNEKFLPSERKMVLEAIAHAHDPEGDGQFNMAHRVHIKSGEPRWLHTISQTQFGEVQGKRVPIYTIASAMDVTEIKTLELKVRLNEGRMTQAVEVSQVGIFEHDHLLSPDGSELFWSTELRELFSADESIKAELDWFKSRIHPDDADAVAACIWGSHDPNSNGEYDIEHRWLHPDGTIHWHLSRGKTSFAEIEGKLTPTHTVGAIIDITDRKAIEDDQKRRTAILEATPDFISITNPQGYLIYLNKAGRVFLGLSEDEDISTVHMSSAHSESGGELLIKEGFPAVFKTGFWKAETEFIRHDGQIIPMSQVLLAHKNNNDEIDFISTIARDLSHEKNLEEQFRQAQKMDAIGRLAGGIAHDFNNMLSVIMGFTSLAIDQLEPLHSAQNQLKQVLHASERAAALTEHLLAFSRKQILQPRVIDINQILLDMETIIGRLVDESIQLKITPAKDICRIKADPSQIEQILLNLSINAKDSMPSGGNLSIEVQSISVNDSRFSKQLDLPDGPYIEISVSDTGHGMDAKTAEKVFEPFFTTKESGQGTGLGLATVFGIVKQSGGNIWLYSEPDQGTVFKLYFPSTDEDESTIAFEDSAPLEHNTDKVLLIAEDEEQLRTILTTLLENTGYTILSAKDGVEALHVSNKYKGKIDLLLSDVVMPRMNGKQLADQLLQTRPETLVLYMSGYTEDNIVHNGVLNEDINFLPKPITPQKLLTAVHKVLSQN